MNIINNVLNKKLKSISWKVLPRPYLGLSQIGHPCKAYLWFYFRWASKVTMTPKKEATFSRGHSEEERLRAYLKHLGINILDDKEEFSHSWGHSKGHIDNLGTNIPGLDENEVALIEYKTAQEKYWKQRAKKSLKEYSEEYYGQIMTYMQKSRYKLKNCLHIFLNKNTDELHFELVKKDEQTAEILLTKADDIILSPVPMKRLSEDPTYFRCTWCDLFNVCHLHENYEKTCRTCSSSEPCDEGKWICTNPKVNKHELSLADQEAACDKYDSIKA